MLFSQLQIFLNIGLDHRLHRELVVFAQFFLSCQCPRAAFQKGGISLNFHRLGTVLFKQSFQVCLTDGVASQFLKELAHTGEFIMAIWEIAFRGAHQYRSQLVLTWSGMAVAPTHPLDQAGDWGSFRYQYVRIQIETHLAYLRCDGKQSLTTGLKSADHFIVVLFAVIQLEPAVIAQSTEFHSQMLAAVYSVDNP